MIRHGEGAVASVPLLGFDKLAELTHQAQVKLALEGNGELWQLADLDPAPAIKFGI